MPRPQPRSAATRRGPDPALYPALFAACPDAVLVLSGDRVEQANPAAAELFGRAVDGASVPELFTGPLPAAAASLPAGGWEGRLTLAGTGTGTGTGGGTGTGAAAGTEAGNRPAAWVRLVELGPGPPPVRALFCRPGGGDRVATDGRAATQEYWRQIGSPAPWPVVLLALDGGWLRANRAACRLLGCQQEQLGGRPDEQMIHPEDLAADRSRRGQLLAGRIEHYTLAGRLLRPGGGEVEAGWSVFLARGDEQEPLHFVCQLTDASAARRSDRRLAALVAHAGDAHLSLDGEGRVVGWNPAAEVMFGWRADEAIGRPLADLVIPPEERAAHRAGLARLEAGGPSSILDRRVELTALRRDGGRFPVELTVWRLPEEPHRYHGFVRDVSDRVQSRRIARHQAARQAALIDVQFDLAEAELSPVVVMSRICERAKALTGSDHAVLGLVEDGDLVLQAATRGCRGYPGLRLGPGSGLAAAAMRAGCALLCVDSETDARVEPQLAARLSARSMVAVPLRGQDRVLGVLGVLAGEPGRFDEDDRLVLDALAAPFAAALMNAWRLQANWQQASVDALTGLANRKAGLAALDAALSRRSAEHGQLAVMFLDLDGFKRVNDSWGHGAGDELLALVARRLRAALRPADQPARYGGDEFLVVCPDLGPPAATALAERLVAAVGASYRLTDRDVAVGASVGVAVTAGPVPAADLLTAADQAMYEAKRAGGRSVRVRQVAWRG